ncbi:hypothetical protein M433DRAFT_27087 [Acidomyces richmondensis BFW]|nr:MAG: hypothetical protein FE78DRAFT_101728 [Acidomyces sp. 'richmondensis']KYG42152.1 hypothetical protein M433DRAFT_27087 [Acidomyces richmondensis BFW]
MSTTRNVDAVSNQQDGGGGAFHARIERDEPLMTHGHKPGIKVGNDAKPEFNAQILPPGSAPSDRTFQPNVKSETPPGFPTSEKIDSVVAQPPPNDFPGATSSDVHTGLGHPGHGQTSTELRHDGQHTRKKVGSGGTDGLQHGAQGKTVDPQDPKFASQRALDKDDAQIGRGNLGGPAAEEKIPENSDTVAVENKIGRNTRS